MKARSLVALFGLVACSSSAKTPPPPTPGGDGVGAGRTHAFAIGHATEAGDLLAASGLPRDPFQLFPFPGLGHIVDQHGTLVWQAE